MFPQRASTPKVLYEGSPEEPAIAVVLGDSTRIFVQSDSRLDDSSAQAKIEPVDMGTMIAVSRNWKYAVRYRLKQGRLWWKWLHRREEERPLSGFPALEPSDDGNAILATDRPIEGPRSLAVITSGDGSPTTIPDLRNTAFSPDGSTILAPTPSELRVILPGDREEPIQESGTEEAWFSSDGSHFFFRKGNEVHVRRTSSPGQDVFPPADIDDDEVRDTSSLDRKEAIVQPRRLTVLDLDDEAGTTPHTRDSGHRYTSAAYHGPSGALAVAWQRVEKHPMRGDQGEYLAGSAELGVDLIGSPSTGRGPRFTVTEWNAVSPRVRFEDGGRLIIYARPSVWAWTPQ